MKFQFAILLVTALLLRPVPGAENNNPTASETQGGFTAVNATAETVSLGSADPNSGFMFLLELDNRGASISSVTLTGFKNRDPRNPAPLKLLSASATASGGLIPALSAGRIMFPNLMQQFPLDRLRYDVQTSYHQADGSQTIQFSAVVLDAFNLPALSLTRTYHAVPGMYDLSINDTVENLSPAPVKIQLDLPGPGGISQEGVRSDMRKAIAGFRQPQGGIVSVARDTGKLAKAKNIEDRLLEKSGADLLWVATVNKYFAAILVPMPSEGSHACDWIRKAAARYSNPDDLADTGDENIAIELTTVPVVLGPAGSDTAATGYNWRLYIGPKDKSLFDKNRFYKDMGFLHTITFMPCFCCPSAVINPLAFAILTSMKWMYGFVPNYGVVIIVLVFLVRLAMHPITKKSQVSMSKFSKIAPRAEQIKKQYANNKAEMNRQVMALYKEQGSSPVMGFLPMLVQMPIWIALYSAIYASIELRGAAFLPFWITDLSAPDALVSFQAVTIPLLKWKVEALNLLPILMGVAMYLQQKMMPKSAAVNPQAAQQQKMMMIMMPLMFPLLLYKAPSGLNLYIMASTFAGVIEQHVIRKHIAQREQDAEQGLVATTSKAGGRTKKKKPKPFFRTMR